jgi:nucleotide-binding universal stress UspA family protein
MAGNDTARVIVGISNSLAGYEALRYAVAEARRRGAALIAVRAFRYSYYGAARQFDHVIYEGAQEAVTAALAEALGGPPCDVKVRVLVREGIPGRVLAEVADTVGDVIVIGGSDRRTMFGLRRGIVARDCSQYAICPVVVIPIPEMARAGSQARLARLAADQAQQFVRRG